MDCEACRDKLPDFLLDELPGAEAVFVQEHLALCPPCETAYRELKGTGKALEAVAARGSVRASPDFDEQVTRAARRESERLIEDLPPERRLRAEARRATRKRRAALAAPAGPARPVWTLTAGAILLVGLLVAGAILFYRSGPQPGPKTLGVLALHLGRVEQFYRKAGEHWSAVIAGQPVQTGEAYATGDEGRARVDLTSGGGVFLGPSTEVRFLALQEANQELGVELVRGELVVERPEKDPAAASPAPEYRVQCAGATAKLPPGAKLLVSLPKQAALGPPTATTILGQVLLAHERSAKTLSLLKGCAARLKPDNLELAVSPPSPAGTTPAWRVDLLTEAELGRLLSGRVRILGRRKEGLELQLAYGFGQSEGLADWRTEAAQSQLSSSAGGGLQVPAQVRFALAAPFTVPLVLEAGVQPQTPRETGWVLTVLERPGLRVSADLGSEAVLQASAGAQTRTARVAYREKPGAREAVRLEVSRRGAELQATLTTSAGATPPLSVAADPEEGGQVSLRAVAGGLFLEGLRVTGLVPREWLRSKADGL